jgi:ketosteroid isomerase-like protein
MRSLYSAFNARDVDACLAAMAPDVDWANGWEGGRVIGRAAVRDYWERQMVRWRSPSSSSLATWTGPCSTSVRAAIFTTSREISCGG